MKMMTGAAIAALAFGLASTPIFAADTAQTRGRDRGQDATQQEQPNNASDRRDRRRGHRDNAKQPTPGGNDRVRGNRQNMDNRSGDRTRDRTRNRSNRTNTDYNNDRNRGRMDRNRRDNNDNNRWRNNDRRNDRDWSRNNRRNININNYRRNITSPRRYRHGTYRWPRGHNYRPWQHGQRLPVMFWRDRSYWLFDFVAFGLFAPPSGYVWVRYGSDALLIDTETGEIIQVRYNVFYA